MATMYAWTPIRHGVDEKGRAKEVKLGEEVTKAKLGVSDEDFEAMVEGGSIRAKKYPAPADYAGSARDFLFDQIREASDLAGADALVEAQNNVVAEVK